MNRVIKTRISTAHFARELLSELSMTTLPINPKEIIKQKRILLKEFDDIENIEGFILRKNGNAIIGLNKNITSETRKKFTLAHELGHYKIPSHQNIQEYKCSKEDIENFQTDKDIEAEANEFAAELIMPKKMIINKIEENDPSISIIQEIASNCETSFLSTAFRYTKLTEFPVVFFVSENKKLKYFIYSDKISNSKKYFFENPGFLNSECLTYSFFDNYGNVINKKTECREISPYMWFPAMKNSNVECFEEVIPFPSYNMTCSLISIIENEEEEEDDEEF